MPRSRLNQRARQVGLLAALGLQGVATGACSRGTAGSEAASTSEASTSEASTSEGATSESESTGLTDPEHPCENSQVLLQSGDEPRAPSGLEVCEDQRVHAVGAETCQVPTSSFWSCTDPGAGPGDCTSDADCTESAYGHCQQQFAQAGAPTGCGCVYGCAQDSECGPNQACICEFGAAVQSMCLPTDCRTDAECEPGRLCKYDNFCDPFGNSLHCESGADDCTLDSDCGPGELCRWAEDGSRWTCRLIACG